MPSSSKIDLVCQWERVSSVTFVLAARLGVSGSIPPQSGSATLRRDSCVSESVQSLFSGLHRTRELLLTEIAPVVSSHSTVAMNLSSASMCNRFNWSVEALCELTSTVRTCFLRYTDLAEWLM
ncbi:hypothetical protein ElyMa_001560300 [Elysia marginata]|uniref:Uncharacterized protein n=1 Tax=Elysia marginata TaxID=1093978 RepID=A0AAV4JCS6_9GAST|nr:hypothetical protein ElyMa_001560300 [Elysia marginata]